MNWRRGLLRFVGRLRSIFVSTAGIRNNLKLTETNLTNSVILVLGVV